METSDPRVYSSICYCFQIGVFPKQHSFGAVTGVSIRLTGSPIKRCLYEQIRTSPLAGKYTADRFTVWHEATEQPIAVSAIRRSGEGLLTAVPWEMHVSSCGVGNGFSINVVMVAG
jgi:hypothetical protein